MADNPRRAGRECRERVREVFHKREALLDALDNYFSDSDRSLDEAESWISTYLGKHWKARNEWKIQKRKENTYNLKRYGIMRLRKMPVGSPQRVHWYETGDGRVDALEKKRSLSLHSKYQLTLSAGPKKRKFTYV